MHLGFLAILLSVPDQVEVKVSSLSSTEPTRAHMQCKSMCPDSVTYIWFRDGHNVQQGVSYTGNITSEANYSCAVEGYKDLHSALVYAPKTPSVTVSPSGGIEEGSSVTLSCSSDANPAANYTWFKEHEDSVRQSGQNYTITNITSELGGNYYCQALNAIGHHNSLIINVPMDTTSSSSSLSSLITAAAVGTIGIIMAIILTAFFWMRTKRTSREACGQGGKPKTVEEPLPGPVYDDVSALTNGLAPVAQTEPTEQQADHHYAKLHISHSENQEVPRCLSSSRVQSDHTPEVTYSTINFRGPKAVPEGGDQRETSVVYSNVKTHPPV